MTKKALALDEWRELYDLMKRVQEVAPWEWMEEVDLFGVQNPATDELGFVSVMGMLGEHYAISVYLGAEALYKFWEFQDEGHLTSPESLFEIPQLQASFEDREQLAKEDHDILKQLQLKFRGKSAWPLFRSIHPGFVPWFLEADEIRFMKPVLEQTIEVALRFKEEPELLEPPDDESYFCRVPVRKKGKITWEDRMISVSPPEERTIPIAMDVKLLETLKKKPQAKNTFEVDLFMFPTPVQEKRGRPFFPYILMTVDAQSTMILGNDMMQPSPSLESIWRGVPMKIASLLATTGIIPKEIKVRSDLLMEILNPLAEELGIKLKQSHRLRSLDNVKEALFQHFM